MLYAALNREKRKKSLCLMMGKNIKKYTHRTIYNDSVYILFSSFLAYGKCKVSEWDDNRTPKKQIMINFTSTVDIDKQMRLENNHGMMFDVMWMFLCDFNDTLGNTTSKLDSRLSCLLSKRMREENKKK